jgi:hypothetical protein
VLTGDMVSPDPAVKFLIKEWQGIADKVKTDI